MRRAAQRGQSSGSDGALNAGMTGTTGSRRFSVLDWPGFKLRETIAATICAHGLLNGASALSVTYISDRLRRADLARHRAVRVTLDPAMVQLGFFASIVPGGVRKNKKLSLPELCVTANFEPIKDPNLEPRRCNCQAELQPLTKLNRWRCPTTRKKALPPHRLSDITALSSPVLPSLRLRAKNRPLRLVVISYALQCYPVFA